MSLHTKILIAIVSVVVILVILFLFLANKNTTNTSNSQTVTNSDTHAISVNDSQSLTPTLAPTSPTPIPQSKTVEKLVFTYPSTWKESALPVVNGGMNFQFNSSTSGDPYFPEFSIQETPASAYPSIEYLVNYLTTSYKLPAKQISYKGISTFDIEGLESITITAANPVYKRFLIVPYQNNTYVINYAYYSKGPDAAANKAYLENLVNSFSFLP